MGINWILFFNPNYLPSDFLPKISDENVDILNYLEISLGSCFIMKDFSICLYKLKFEEVDGAVVHSLGFSAET
jgi:hypothetical protein